MQLHVKAALLSALLVPGLGQLYKGCRLKGGILIALVNLFLLGAAYFAMQGVGRMMLSSKIPGTPGPAVQLENLKHDTPAARWLLVAFFGLWLYAALDALLAGGNRK